MDLGLAVLILMKNSPWDIRLSRYPRYKKVMVDLEQPLGNNMTKVLNLSALNCQNTQGIYSDKVLLSEPTSHYHE